MQDAQSSNGLHDRPKMASIIISIEIEHLPMLLRLTINKIEIRAEIDEDEKLLII
jgi:hypothetical protein